MVFERAEEQLKLLIADQLGQLMFIVEQTSLPKDWLVCTAIQGEKGLSQSYFDHFEGSLLGILPFLLIKERIVHLNINNKSNKIEKRFCTHNFIFNISRIFIPIITICCLPVPCGLSKSRTMKHSYGCSTASLLLLANARRSLSLGS